MMSLVYFRSHLDLLEINLRIIKMDRGERKTKGRNLLTKETVNAVHHSV